MFSRTRTFYALVFFMFYMPIGVVALGTPHIALASSASPFALSPLQLDVAGISTGAEAVGVDSAATAFANSAQLSYTYLRNDTAQIVDINSDSLRPATIQRFMQRFMHRLSFSLPFLGMTWFGGARLGDSFAGHTTTGYTNSGYAKSQFGFAIKMNETIALGGSTQQFDGGVKIWDLSLRAELNPVLTFSLSTHSNFPMTKIGRIDSAIGLRPFLGNPRVTTAFGGSWFADTTPLNSKWGTHLSTKKTGIELFAQVDIALVRGLHTQIQFRRGIDASQFLSLGLTVDLGGVQLRSAVAAAFPYQFSHASNGLSAAAFGVTLGRSYGDAIFTPSEKEVTVFVQGNLQTPSNSLFTADPMIADLPRQLSALASHQEVGTVRLIIGRLAVGMAMVEELQQAVLRLRAAGKQVIAEISSVDEKGYLVAAACNKIRIDPLGVVTIDGFAISVDYLAGALKKIGVTLESVEIGDYKTAADTVTREQPRKEADEVMGELLSHAYAQLTSTLINMRNMTKAQVTELIEKGSFTAQEAIDRGLVDSLITPIEAATLPRFTPMGYTLEELNKPRKRWGSVPKIAVIPVLGTIVISAEDNPLPGKSVEASQVIESIEDAQFDSDVAAVVVRINSPGGDVIASDLIWRALRRLNAVKPVVISMGDVAASGGYWIATAGAWVMANRSTITGSIGVLAIKPNLSGLYTLLGINNVVYKKGPHADAQLTSQPMGDANKKRLTHILQNYYQRFVERVSFGRGMSINKAKEIAGGRVYTGKRAKELSLVDEFGTLFDAIKKARLLAGLDANESIAVTVPRGETPLLRLLGGNIRGKVSVTDVIVAWQKQIRGLEQQVLAIWLGDPNSVN